MSRKLLFSICTLLALFLSVQAQHNPTDSPVEADKSHTDTRPKKVKSVESLVLQKLPEAKRVLENDCELDNFTVGISLLDRKSGKIRFVKMSKSNFLTPGYTEEYRIGDETVSVRVDHPNYVNTKLEVTSPHYLPLMVKYPIIKGEKLKEMAYYTPAHRALQLFDFAKLGEEYVDQTIEKAAASLKKNGIQVPEKIRDLAKLLCIVEHIDHIRFRTEPSQDLFREVQTLYALNRGETYRYSVSSAGAGGMVQMIHSTYKEICKTFPDVPLLPDFEAGMIHHPNAARAMLLYLKRYNGFFLNQQVVNDAIDTGLATEEELMAAGYNSNPVNVPKKLSYGKGWKYYLPRETQVYLSILHALDSSVTTGPLSASERNQYAVYKPKTSIRSRHSSIRSRVKVKLSKSNKKPVTRSHKRTTTSRARR